MSFFKKIFGSGDKDDIFLGIDIGTSAIKLVQIGKEEGEFRLQTYGLIELGPETGNDVGSTPHVEEDVLPQAMLELSNESRTSTESCAVSLPIRSSLLSIISLPKTIGEKDLPNIVPIEARKHIPVPMEDVELDWMLLPDSVDDKEEEGTEEGQDSEKDSEDESQKDGSEESVKKDTEESSGSKNANEDKAREKATYRILVVAIHKELLGSYTQMLRSTHLDPTAYELMGILKNRTHLIKDREISHKK